MMGMSVRAALPPPSERSGAGAPEVLRSSARLNESLASPSSPKVRYSLRITSYGGVSPCSSSSTFGLTSSSTKRRTASRIARCSSDHSNMTCLPAASTILAGADPTGRSFLDVGDPLQRVPVGVDHLLGHPRVVGHRRLCVGELPFYAGVDGDLVPDRLCILVQ